MIPNLTPSDDVVEEEEVEELEPIAPSTTLSQVLLDFLMQAWLAWIGIVGAAVWHVTGGNSVQFPLLNRFAVMSVLFTIALMFALWGIANPLRKPDELDLVAEERPKPTTWPFTIFIGALSLIFAFTR